MGGGALTGAARRVCRLAGRPAGAGGVWPRRVMNSTPPMKKQKNDAQMRILPQPAIHHHEPESEPPESQLPESEPPLSHEPESEPPESHEPESELPQSQLPESELPLSLHQPLSEELLLLLSLPLLGTLGKLPHSTITPMTKSVKPV